MRYGPCGCQQGPWPQDTQQTDTWNRRDPAKRQEDGTHVPLRSGAAAQHVRCATPASPPHDSSRQPAVTRPPGGEPARRGLMLAGAWQAQPVPQARYLPGNVCAGKGQPLGRIQAYRSRTGRQRDEDTQGMDAQGRQFVSNGKRGTSVAGTPHSLGASSSGSLGTCKRGKHSPRALSVSVPQAQLWRSRSRHTHPSGVTELSARPSQRSSGHELEQGSGLGVRGGERSHNP